MFVVTFVSKKSNQRELWSGLTAEFEQTIVFVFSVGPARTKDKHTVTRPSLDRQKITFTN